MSDSQFVKGECRHCGGHLEFPAGAAGQTVPCPHCGQAAELAIAVALNETQTSLSRWKAMAMAIAICLAVAALAAFWVMQMRSRGVASETKLTPAPNVSTNTSVPTSESQGKSRTNDFAILPFKLETTPGSSLVYVIGTVRNLSDRQRFGVKVEFGLFDTNDAPLGSATDYQSVLEPHGEWHFKAMVMASKTAYAKFNSIIEEK